MTAAPNPPLRIQYVSDIHLEHYTFQDGETLPLERWIRPVPGVAALVLAGDIGWPGQAVYHDFLAACSSRWPTVILVAGNHEFYEPGTTVEATLERLRGLCAAFPNVHFLERGSMELAPGLRVLGTTLWTEIPGDMRAAAARGLNDFRCVRLGPERERLTPTEYAAWHARDRAWLEAELEAATAAGEEVLVVTHHMPSFQLINPVFEGNPYNVCFASNLDELIETAAPLAWICGHSHLPNKVVVGRTQLALNPLGYPDEDSADGALDAVLEIRARAP